LGGGLTREIVKAVQARLDEVQPDVLHLEGPNLAPLAILARSGERTVLSAHDSQSLRYREFARFAASRPLRVIWRMRALVARRFEQRWFRRADRIVVTSPADSEALARSVPPERISVIPNGVDADYWVYKDPPKSTRIVFTGNMSWPPNEDAARYFALEVLPVVKERIPDAEFYIVGAEPSVHVRALANLRGVQVTGTVPDIREWVWSASVYVSPLRFGAGVKNKILEAMALGAPIVATPKSLTGTPLQHGRHLLTAESTADLAAAIVRLLGDRQFGQFLSRQARRQAEREYSWPACASRFEELYQKPEAGRYCR